MADHDAFQVCSILQAEEVALTVVGLDRFLSEPEAIWLLACTTCHASAAVRAAALEHLRELDGGGWARDFALLRREDPDARVRARAAAYLASLAASGQDDTPAL